MANEPALDAARLAEILDGFAGVRLLVTGDLVLDEYVRGEAVRISPEAPVPVVRVEDESVVLGGAANVARNVLALGGEVGFAAVVGDDAAGDRAADLLKELGIGAGHLVTVAGRTTPRKTRVVAGPQQVVRFDRESVDPLSAREGRRLLDALADLLPFADAAIVADYGKGALPGGGADVVARCIAAGVPVAVDPKEDPTVCRGAALLKPNLRELRALTGVIGDDEALAIRAARAMGRDAGGADVVVTCGRRGALVVAADGAARAVPTVPREVYDVQGAGDTAMAALWLARCAGASLLEAAVIANAAAGVVVAKIGTATASADEVRPLLPAAVAAARENA